MTFKSRFSAFALSILLTPACVLAAPAGGLSTRESVSCAREQETPLPNFLRALASQMAPEPLSDYSQCASYVSGRTLEAANKALIEFEKGHFVTVPLDYNNSSAGTTRVYAYFAEAYDPAKPTYVFFTGGPGQNAHLQENSKFAFFKNAGYNLLLLDQRGLGFSRFDTETQARNADNYSSENTARDMARVLDYFKLKKVTVYGASYGTVPATIFASLFPERSSGVVLEGVVYDGWSGAQAESGVANIIEKMFKTINPKAREKFLQLVRDKKITNFWYPLMAKTVLANGGTADFSYLKQAIERAMERNVNSDTEIMAAWDEIASEANASPNQAPYPSSLVPVSLPKNSNVCLNILDSGSEDVNQLLQIKEFGAGRADATSHLVLEGERVVRFPGGNYSSFVSKFTNLDPLAPEYSAKNYPLLVPVTYLQGEFDAATPASGAVAHFKNTAKGKAQLLLFEESSHMPTGTYLFEGGNPAKMEKIFRDALGSQGMNCDELRGLAAHKYGRIRYSERGFASGCK